MSRDKNAWPEPCLYCQLREEEENEEEEPSVPELRFVPAESAHLQEMLDSKSIGTVFRNFRHSGVYVHGRG